ncbi:MAG: glycerol-3-phosphate 1-O-acyltransferase PlsY [Acutalibacteraceae bacterium]|nr:glycerol-3-phosphate 1-O-acyltransferase PlsY [Acutalibacteraceae bacterium]
MEFLWAFLTVVLAYMIGSINFAIIFTNAFVHRDVRDYGSGNAGMTNVLRVVGKKAGILTFVCDALKGLVACLIGRLVFAYLLSTTGNEIFNPVYGAYICGVAVMLGHVFPLFFGFKGGKGVAVSVGIFLVCNPIAIISGLATFGILLLTTRIISISSLSATVIVVSFSMIFYFHTAEFWPQAIGAFIMGAIVFLKHAENIGRLIRGEEKKLAVKKED